MACDTGELVTFLESNALFHDQYQKFGNVHFEKTPSGARGLSPSVTLAGPPERMMPFGSNSRMRASGAALKGQISQ